MTAATDIDWMVISLARTPERLEQFRANNAGVGVPVEVFAAIDGLQLEREQLVRDGLLGDVALHWTMGAMGAALSHRALWQQVVASGRPMVIFEDDIVLRRDFIPRALGLIDAMPADWQIIQFGINTDSIMDVEFIPGFNLRGDFSVRTPTIGDCRRFAESTGEVVPVRLNHGFGASAYAISPTGAAEMLEKTFPMAHRAIPIEAFNAFFVPSSGDGMMQSVYPKVPAYVSLPPIALPINDKTVSTVW